MSNRHCHDESCDRLSYTASSCQCGFTAELLSRTERVPGVHGYKVRTASADSPLHPVWATKPGPVPMTDADLADFLADCRARSAALDPSTYNEP